MIKQKWDKRIEGICRNDHKDRTVRIKHECVCGGGGSGGKKRGVRMRRRYVEKITA